VKEFLDEAKGIPISDGGGAVNGDVADFVDGADFLEEAGEGSGCL